MIKKLVIIIALAILIASVAGCTSSPTSSPTNSTTSSITSTPTSGLTSTPTSTTPSTQTGVVLSAYRNGTASSDSGTLYQITVNLTNYGPRNFDYDNNITFYISGQPVKPTVENLTNVTVEVPAGEPAVGFSSVMGPGSTGLITFGFESAYPTMLTYNDGNSTKTVQL
jgi:hypothetical protein